MPRGVIAFALLVSASLSLPQHPAIADPAFGNFEGRLIVEILDDGRNVELKTPFAYKDFGRQAVERADGDRRQWRVDPAGILERHRRPI